MFNTVSITAAMLFALAAVISLYEKREIVIEKVVLISLLSSLAAVGRILFGMLPSIQPASFIIIVAGIVFGKEMGMMTGIVTAVVSNLVLGQGPWTPWQMFLWGMMGFLAGVLSEPLLRHKAARLLYGFAWGFIFGWGMNMWFIIGYEPEVSFKVFVLAVATSFYMDLLHALSNLLLILFAGDRLIRTCKRIRLKYFQKDKRILMDVFEKE